MMAFGPASGRTDRTVIAIIGATAAGANRNGPGPAAPGSLVRFSGEGAMPARSDLGRISGHGRHREHGRTARGAFGPFNATNQSMSYDSVGHANQSSRRKESNMNQAAYDLMFDAFHHNGRWRRRHAAYCISSAEQYGQPIFQRDGL
jgi:hypothetical protein